MKFPLRFGPDPLIVSLSETFGIKLSDTSVGRLLRPTGIELQKTPLFRAYQKNPELIEQWKQRVPAIKEAKQVGAAIYLEDESGIRSIFIPAPHGRLRDKRR